MQDWGYSMHVGIWEVRMLGDVCCGRGRECFSSTMGGGTGTERHPLSLWLAGVRGGAGVEALEKRGRITTASSLPF